MVVANGDSLSSKLISLAGRGNKHDAVMDAESELTIKIHQRCNSQIGQRKECSALTNIAPVQVGIGDSHHGNGVPGIDFGNLTTRIGGKAVSLIK